MKSLNIDELMALYNEAETCDQDLFAEQRSNLLLVSGDHYNKKGSRYLNRIRDSKDLSQEQKLRLTKNHVQKISKTYVNALVAYAPSVIASPNNEQETQDQKDAQLNNSVIQYAKRRHKITTEKTLQWAEDFVNIGELCVKIFWDPFAGDVIGEEMEVDEETGYPVIDEATQTPVMKPRFSGDMMIERVYGFNLLRTPTTTDDMNTSSPLIIRKMVSTAELRAKVGNDPEKLKAINDSEDKTFHVFDAAQGNYSMTSKGQTMLLEYYFPKCVEYPKGYFYYTTLTGKLWEGELPFGIWPIIYTGFDAIQTSPRHRSIIKQLRPYQAEINRSGSKIAEHQITLGDDKLLLSGNTKISNGVQLPGVRSIQFSGSKPEHLPGRAGDQYLAYMNSQIQEMYQIANLDAEQSEKDSNSGDMLMNLYKNIRQKKKFILYNLKFENFIVQFWETYLELAKNYFPDEMLIPMLGRQENVNISEFRSTDKLCYSIKVEPQSDDVESMMGKQIIMNHVVQYVGQQLDKKSLGKIMQNMPFGNFKEAFSELTMDETMATNMILALDRGQVPLPNKYDDHLYMIKRLTDRVRQADFAMLDERIQKNYHVMIAHYDGLEVKRQQELKQAESEFIPSGGPRVKVDFYVSSPGNPNRTERATLPAESVDWLIKKLADQGSSQEALSQLNQGAVSDIAGKFNQLEGSQLATTGMDAPVQQGPDSPRSILQ